ncbi:MAG TPA: LacI family DNA-binding transcriptional regulator [Propionicimonas sp.]|nr:LacI family DNA-binding transcriptional regulator [Propionicimonas sp.]HRA06462.1 LacI family DNA-binding transcriptional regulator [Propionicimonas sp.]
MSGRSTDAVEQPSVRPRRPSVTRADVAKLAGVSTAVVSYVVNDGPRPVAPATAVRVREAMEMLGYLPNASARALRLGSTGTLGLVLGDSQNPHFSEYTYELGQVAAAHGKRLLIADTRQDESLENQIVEDLVSRQVDGLLFASPLSQIDENLPLRVAGTPVVLIDCPGPIPGRRTVGADAAGGAELLVNHLIEHGRERIGLIVGDSGFGDPDPREQGWRRALQGAGLPDGPIVRVPFTREGGYAGAQVVLDQEPRVDAVFASNDLQGIGLVRALQERGLRIPEDVAVVAFDGTKESAFCWPPLTVARQPRAALAEAAIGLLLEPGTRGRHIQLPTELVRRASCGCAHADDVDQPQANLLTRG